MKCAVAMLVVMLQIINAPYMLRACQARYTLQREDQDSVRSL